MSKKGFWSIAVIVIIAIGGFFGYNAVTKSDAKDDKNEALKELNIQLVPSSQADTMEAKAKPLEKLLSNELGIPVNVSVSTDYNTVVEALGSKQVDMGFLPPHPYVYAHEKYGAEVLLQSQRFGIDPSNNDGAATDKLSDTYRGMVLVREDSDIKSPEDLKGKSIAVQNTTSDAGYIFPAVDLNKDDNLNVVKDAKLITVKGHDQGVLSVLNGDTDAAFMFEDARNVVKKDQPDVFKNTRVVKFTQPIPNDTITLRAGISESDAKRIQDAMLKIFNENAEGKKVMEEVYSWSGVTKSKDSNFDIVREYQKYIDDMN
ncbi:phosphate/phosphite/phosphonate ABC transporter substrate-binding protein [Weissella tructae]|uniref:Phosphonate ABC superfamily ATP binding cassette transporter, binding protein n=2 Tax=Weissella TaxID=46255 RepID=A0A075TW75_9LACO|nr:MULTISPECIES: phosphate/phosphite/phosphonate ABC transporter substrate-binding protein [Weissella]AIG65824.1 Phosphonate ABC superfamily ATP binding cassette transporter, binding protein [Weissella tructae]AIM63203.1 Phosphonate ABC superfamily ATP binding cassette transporter, binding protein [Weissella ceti]AIM64538.1 Phosphonate ABC superfamily ATP binding cassette transporter, binding protein [Weissella ceti]ELA06724.1 transport protein [Weissella ceti NC36]QVV90983.1 phosphate/phosphi